MQTVHLAFHAITYHCARLLYMYVTSYRVCELHLYVLCMLHNTCTSCLNAFTVYPYTCVYTTPQVITLDERCRPRYLKQFTNPYSNAHFGIICTNLTLHFATVMHNSTVVVHELSTGCQSDTEGILVESNNGVQALSVIDTTIIDVCGVNSGGSGELSLPTNVYCERDTNLYPLHGHEAFLLHCISSEGRPTLYVVSLDPNVDAQSISAEGLPYSSPNGKYVIMVDARKTTVYNIEDTSSPGNAKAFSASITTVEFLDSHHVLFLTADNRQFLIDLENISSSANDFSGGQAISWVWVNSSKVFVYATEGDDDLYSVQAFNTTSMKLLFELKDIVDEPEMMLFVEKSATTDPPPTAAQDDPIPAIVGSSAGGLLFVVAVFVVTLGLLSLYMYKRPKNNHRLLRRFEKIPNPPTTVHPTPEAPPHMQETNATDKHTQVCISDGFKNPYGFKNPHDHKKTRKNTATESATTPHPGQQVPQGQSSARKETEDITPSLIAGASAHPNPGQQTALDYTSGPRDETKIDRPPHDLQHPVESDSFNVQQRAAGHRTPYLHSPNTYSNHSDTSRDPTCPYPDPLQPAHSDISDHEVHVVM